ncbi:hypothetical protein D7223_00460 [Micromonospora endolithica]|uniref:Uncharacterized protein n=2 Tax=Micromonospora endolithica TaxID=230091 RepID=A0A3A9ZSN2_9ACTN|nr:hypothetical protein D7223_00460 [Micromonospora endolithica]TWJ21016.1 hypothetical protein JD76_01116 [Micromonospora endolithica]
MPHWLPERHLGVAATLSHADELIGQVGDLLFAYQTQAQGVLGLREVPAGSFSRTVVGSVAPIPRKVPLLVADALVALRAALEHTLFAEVEFLDGAPLDEKAARLVEIPASDTYEKFEEWTKKQLRNRPPSLRAGSELVRRIDRLQPFHRQSDPQTHPLARLVLHTNHAKHRTPAITAVRLAAMYQDNQMPRSVRDLPPRPEEPLRVGDVIAETPIGTTIPVTLFPTIGINRPGTSRWPVLMQELDEISHWVRTQAVPRLVTGTEPPEPALRTRYEIAVGHQDERHAMSMGSTTSAADRQIQRLGAAVVRTDLVGLIGQVDGSPSNQQIAAWLAQLTDEEVLDRMSRLKVTHSYNPGVMLHNVEVLEGLRDEALGFAHADARSCR